MSIYEPLKIFGPPGCVYFAPNRGELMRQMCRDKSVLHIGCADAPLTQQRIREGTLLHALLEDVAKSMIGIDLCEESLAIMRDHGYHNIMAMDAESLSSNSFGTHFDAVVAGDVLEHVNNPGKVIDGVRSVLATGGQFIVGVPSALTFNTLTAWCRGTEQVHKDHCFYYSPKTLACLCRRYELLPTRLAFTVQPLADQESRFFGTVRSCVLRVCKQMAPSIVMTFQTRETVNQKEYSVWK